jgi:DNA polymerase-3 subunit gamma/tau
LLVVRIAGQGSKLVAASPSQRDKLAAASEQFSEEDLTRDLKLSLDLFRDLQSSLQPRLHLELGLLRLIHAGRLRPIEEALAALGGSGSGPAAGKTPVASPAPKAPERKAEPAGSFRERLHAALIEAKQVYVADAVQSSEVVESPNEVVFTTPREYQLNLKGAEFEAAVRRVAGRQVRVVVKVGEPVTKPVAAAAPVAAVDEVSTRALEHPEVKRFQEMFPDSHVRAVRNLKEN